MKLIIAYFQPERLTDVKQALFRADVTKFSVTTARGCGAQRGYHERYRGTDVQIDLLPKARIEVAVNDAFLQPAIDAIIEAASTEGPTHDPDQDADGGGGVGDGKIFVMPLDDCIRIRTGERGSPAVG